LALGGCSTPTPTPAPPTIAPAPATPTSVPPKATLAPVPPTQAPAAPTQVPAPVKPVADQAAITKLWASGRHNNTYDLGRGPNTYCARCHSPGNWDPKAVPGKPPNCMSCKFPTDKEVRIATTNALIPAADWKMVGCYVCHETKGTVVDAKIAIWNNGTGKYDQVTSTTDLCEKCHADSIGGSMHKINLGGGAHSNQIGQIVQRPEACTDCHDPHSMKADCKKCHADSFPPAKTTTAGHDAAHANVTCVGCHNSLPELRVDKVPGTNLISTGTFGSGMGGGPPAFTPAYSHEFKKAVVCTVCHFDNNPLKLRSLVTPTPAPAAVTPAAGTPAPTKPAAPAAGTPAAVPSPSPTK
jgi:hypothetical protein